MPKKLKYLVIHCTATPKGREVSPETVRGWHTDPKPKGRGWSRVGYSVLIGLDGACHVMHDYDADDFVDGSEITNGARGINSESRHICYVGGVSDKDPSKPADTRTAAQMGALRDLVRYFVRIHPDIKVAGHNDFAAKACPSFDVEDFCREIGIPEKNIYVP